MQKMDFSESNLWNRWLGVKGFWKLLEGEVKRFIKVRLERTLILKQRFCVGCGRYKRSRKRSGYRNGSYVRDLLTQLWLGRGIGGSAG